MSMSDVCCASTDPADATQESICEPPDLAHATCRVCRCTWEDACRGGCSWFPGAGDLCSTCGLTAAGVAAKIVEIARAGRTGNILAAANEIAVLVMGWREVAHTPEFFVALCYEVTEMIGPPEAEAAEAIAEPGPALLYDAFGGVL